MATVIIPSDHAMTVTFEGREIRTNRVQLLAAHKMLKLHMAGIQFKLGPVTFLNRLFQTRKTAIFWKFYLDQLLA
jgi:hypothetical protein